MEWRDGIAPGTMEVKVAELLVATADQADYLIDGSVREVLKLLRDRMRMDVVFVSEFTGGVRELRAVAQSEGHETVAEGQTDPLETTWCQRVVDGRLPELVPDGAVLQDSGQAPPAACPIGTYLSTPIVLGSGEVYGTLCCFSFGVNPQVTELDVKKLRYTADLTAKKIDRSRRVIAEMRLEPIPDPGFKPSR